MKLARLLFSLAVLCAATTARGQTAGTKQEEWTRPFEPFRIIGNVYWVGTYDLATFLIVTPKGHIVVNTGLAATVDDLTRGIETLGFKVSDVKILTATHGHYDHVAGMAELKRRTGARLLVSENEKELLETGGRSDFLFGKVESKHFEPVKVDSTFADGGTISLGGTELTAHLHPGHTKGATSFTLDVPENGKIYRVLIANMGSINGGVTVSGMPNYPGIAADYARTFAAQKELKIDVWLASHAGQFGLHKKHQPGDPYDPERFVDPAGFLRSVQFLEKTYLKQLADEQAKGSKTPPAVPAP